MLTQMSFPIFANATSSRVSAHGATHCASPDGPMIGLCGQAHAPASRSAPPENSADSPTNGICGRSFTGSSASAALQSLLASRLQARLASLGGTLYAMTWKSVTTPAGRLISRLQASAHHTSDNGSTGWRSPVASEGRGGVTLRMKNGRSYIPRLQEQAVLLLSGMENGRYAQTSSSDRLNPAFVLWLMGLPGEVLCCGVSATQSCRSKRRRLSKQ